MIRPATLTDVHQLLDISLDLAQMYPLRPDRDKMKAIIVQLISSKAHYLMVDSEGNRIVAVLAALTGDNMWAQRKFSNVMLWWSEKPGAGVKLLRGYRDWIKSRRAIKVAGFAPDLDLDERTYALMERVGFKRRGGSYLLIN